MWIGKKSIALVQVPYVWMCDMHQRDKQCLVADLQSGIPLQKGSHLPLDNAMSDGCCIPEGSIREAKFRIGQDQHKEMGRRKDPICLDLLGWSQPLEDTVAPSPSSLWDIEDLH